MSTEGGTPGGTPGKRRRKHSPLAVASVAAAVLLAGGGGAYWASTASDGGGGGGGGGEPGTSAADSSPPPLALDGYGRAPGSSGPGIAVGEPDPGGVRYRATGKLPDGPRTAAVYLPAREVTREEVADLAKALNVQGVPRLVQDTWTVGGTPDAAGPTLQVSRQGPGTWSYARYGVPGGAHCEHPPGAGPKRESGPAPGPGTDAAVPACRRSAAPPRRIRAPPGRCRRRRRRASPPPCSRPSARAARKTDARGVHGALRTVSAEPVLDTLPTYGWQTSLQVGADAQLTGGSGQLQMPRKATAYPMLTARQALDELNKGGGTGHAGIGGCATPAPLGDGSEDPCKDKPGKPEPVEVEGAVFGLSAQSVAGRSALVPSWLFTARIPGTPKDGATVTVAQPAVDPKFIEHHPSPAGRAGARRPLPRGRGRCRWSPTAWTPTAGSSPCTSGAGCAASTPRPPTSRGAAVTVKVTATEKEPGRYCVMMIKQFDTTVALDEPLGDRKVVDLTTGGPVRQLREK
ncbi:hypothetical protein [Streptomyces cinnamoneus]|uniref:hypothetical protein n=1 Tax=Streptomyces cinnamoneus TaxID=53446 RepID=UPI001EFDB950|nr:hypothetical protein [Streptomyces cinnamoneus]